MTRGLHCYPTLFTYIILSHFLKLQVCLNWQNISTISPSKSLNFIWNRQLPNAPPERSHLLGRRALSMLKIKHGLTSNLIGTVHRKLTCWSRSLDQPISRQRRTERNREDSLGIKREEYFMDNIRLPSCYMRAETMASSGKKWGKIAGLYNDGMGNHLSLHNLAVSPLPICHHHPN